MGGACVAVGAHFLHLYIKGAQGQQTRAHFAPPIGTQWQTKFSLSSLRPMGCYACFAKFSPLLARIIVWPIHRLSR
jgi:hypothetical protein